MDWCSWIRSVGLLPVFLCVDGLSVYIQFSIFCILLLFCLHLVLEGESLQEHHCFQGGDSRFQREIQLRDYTVPSWMGERRKMSRP